MPSLLIIDDDQMMCDMLATLGQRMGCEVMSALTLSEGILKAQTHSTDLVLLDVNLPDGNGLDGLATIRETPSCPEVIIITGDGDPDGAELAIRSGAWDYIEKPPSTEAIKLPIVRALEYRERKRDANGAARDAKSLIALKREGIVGNSAKMLECLDGVARAAATDANVLLSGETGTGKELFAWAIHANSGRAERPFVVVDCAALPEMLVESMLFGHTRGAFTGAERSQEGMVKQADGGTLVLDEVGELPLSLQKTFLRVLQERRYRPVGAKEEITSDFRLIAVTNRDLEQMVQEGSFRQDLFFRLRSLCIELPPLRQRSEDLKDLITHYVNRLCERYGEGFKGISPQFIEVLSAYDWPGNIRELVHCVESAIAAARHDPVLFHDHLPVHIRIRVARCTVSRHQSNGVSGATRSGSQPLPKLAEFREAAIRTAEREYLQSLMSLSGMNIQQACRVSDLSRPRLYALMKKYGIKRQAE